MGNHDAGRAMNGAAEAWWDGRGSASPPDKEKALAVLDMICGRWKGSDAEFDDDAEPGTPLGRLMAIAFDASPEALAPNTGGEEDGEAWYDGPYTAFQKRYELC